MINFLCLLFLFSTMATTSLVKKTKGPDYHNYLLQQQEEKKKAIQENAVAIQRLNSVIQKEGAYYQANVGSLKKTVNIDNLNIKGILLHMGEGIRTPTSKGKDIYMHQAHIWVGNLKGSGSKYFEEDEKGINIPVRPMKNPPPPPTTQGAQPQIQGSLQPPQLQPPPTQLVPVAQVNTQQTPQQQQQQQKKKKKGPQVPAPDHKKYYLKSFSVGFFGIVAATKDESDKLNSLRYGDVVSLENVYAEAFMTSAKVEAVSLKAGRVERKPVKGVISIIARALHSAKPKITNKKFEPCVIPYNPEVYVKVDSDMIKVDNTKDWTAVTEQKTSMVVQKITTDHRDWIFKPSTAAPEDPGNPHMNSFFTIYQWDEISKGIHTAYIRAKIYDQIITSCFGISNTIAWAMFAPALMRYLSFFMLGSVDIKQTHEQSSNIEAQISLEDKDKDQEKEVAPIKDKEKYDFGLHYNINGLFVDLASWLYVYGIKVTKQYLLERFTNYSYTKPAQSRANPMASGVVCLNESENPAGIINSSRDDNYRAFISIDLDEEQLDIISRMNAAEGEQFLEFCVSTPIPGMKKMLPEGHPLEKTTFKFRPEEFMAYYYCIEMDTLSRPNIHLTEFMHGKTAPKQVIVYDPATKKITTTDSTQAPQPQTAIPDQKSEIPSGVTIEEVKEPEPVKRKSPEPTPIKKKQAPVEDDDDLEESQANELPDYTSHQQSLSDHEEQEQLEKIKKAKKQKTSKKTK
jgi:hypothetical protein